VHEVRPDGWYHPGGPLESAGGGGGGSVVKQIVVCLGPVVV
jgi:hypothetical protein